MVETIQYKSISVLIKPRKKLYIFRCKYLDNIRKLNKCERLPRAAVRYILNTKGDTITVPEFGLLELEYILNFMITDKELSDSLGIAAITVEDLLSFIRTETWVAARYQDTIPDINYSLIKKEMKFNILPSQKPAFIKYEENKVMAGLRGAMLDAAPGAGKTFMSLALSVGLEYDTTIIIAPRQTLEEVWVQSVSDSLFKTPQPYVILSKKDKNIKGKRFIIMHYEFLDKVVEDTSLVRQIKRLNPNIIIDEFHNFNNIDSKRTKSLLEFIETLNTKDVILLTGTPIKMEIKELYPLLYVLDSKFPKAFSFFSDIYKAYSLPLLNMLKYRFGLYRERIEKDTSNIPPLTVIENKIKIRNYDKYLMENISKDMSEYKEKRYAELISDYNKYYKEFLDLLEQVKPILIKERVLTKTELNIKFKQYLKDVNEVFTLAENGKIHLAIGLIGIINNFESTYIERYLQGEDLKHFRDIKSIIKYPKLKALGEALGKILLARRIECYTELAKNLDYDSIIKTTDKKTVIFSNYIITCEQAINTVNKQGYKPLKVFGEYTKDLDSTVKTFMSPKSKTNPLVATYKSLSTGVPLIAANVMICLDLPFRMYIFDQTVSRIYRLGQDKRTYVYVIKLDTGDDINITQRDLFILNVSKARVEMITSNEFAYELPEEITREEMDDKKLEEEAEDELNNDPITDVVNNIAQSTVSSIFSSIRYNMSKLLDIVKIKINIE